MDLSAEHAVKRILQSTQTGGEQTTTFNPELHLLQSELEDVALVLVRPSLF